MSNLNGRNEPPNVNKRAVSHVHTVLCVCPALMPSEYTLAKSTWPNPPGHAQHHGDKYLKDEDKAKSENISSLESINVKREWIKG